MKDRIILYLAAFLRALALGMIGVLLAIYLAKIDFSMTTIGIIVSFGLAGGALRRIFST